MPFRLFTRGTDLPVPSIVDGILRKLAKLTKSAKPACPNCTNRAQYSAAAKPDRHGMALEAEKVAPQGAKLDGLQLESGVGSARPPRACFLSAT